MSYLSRPRGYMLLAVIIVATALAGCMTPSVPPAPPALQADEEVVTMFVGPAQADCVGEGPQKCLLVKEGSADGPYLMFYSNIKGFDYKEGSHYELLVRKTKVENPPAGGSSISYELVEEVSKTPAGNVSTIYVAPMMVECETTEIFKCLLVADSPDGEYKPFYGKIDGFDYEEGYQYSLLVEEVAMDQPPSDAPAGVWNLLAVTRKEPAAPVSAVPSQTALEGTLWLLTSYVDADGKMQPILEGSEVSATFLDGRLVGNAGCNNYTAGYTLDGNMLTIGPAASTMMACISMEVTAQETAYLGALSLVASYQVSGETLSLMNEAGDTLLEYIASTPISLTGTTWQVTGYNNGREAVVGIIADTQLTMTLGEDGQISGSAGCNNFSGGYTVDGETIAIGPLASTMMMCVEPEGIMEQEQLFLAALQAATTFSLHGDKLDLRDDTGALQVGATAQRAEVEAPAAANSPLEGTQWTLTSYTNDKGEAVAPVEGTEVTAIFMDGRVSGNASCNNYSAEYTVDGNSMQIGLGISTMMMCQPETVAAQEQAYLAALERVATYEIVGESLALADAEGNVLLTFEVLQPTSLVGTDWQIINYNNGKEAVVSVTTGTQLTMTFGEDGQISGSAGCNNFSGGYTVDGETIAIGPLASTMMMCVEPEGIMEQEAQLLAALQAATTFVIQGDGIEMRDDTGALQVMATAQPAEVEAPAAANSPLEGMQWTLTSYTNDKGEAVAPVEGTEVTAVFMDGRVSGNASCNNYSAEYTIDGNSMQIGLGISTMMMCQPETVAAQEQTYLAALERVATYEIVGESLALADAEGNVLLTFEVLQQTPVVGTDWQVGFYNNGKQALVTPIAGSSITMLFMEDGSVSGSASCNNFSGDYRLEGDQLTIGPLGTTRMLCAGPEGIMDQETAFLAALESTATYRIVGDELELLNAEGARAVTANALALELAAGGNPEDVMGKTWLWQNTVYTDQNEMQPAEPTAYTLELLSDGSALVRSDCNSLAGTYTMAEDGGLTIELPTTGLSNCEEESLSTQYLADLNRVSVFSLADGALYLQLDAEAGSMEFAEAGATTTATPGDMVAAPPEISMLTGQVWAWQSLDMSDGSVTSVETPEQYTVEFMADGTLNVQADCNTGRGAYVEDNGSLRIEAVALTRMACPPDSLSDQFIARLNDVASYVIDDGQLYLNLKLDSGNLVFAPLAAGEDRGAKPTPEPVVVEPTPAASAAPGRAALIIGPTWQWIGFQNATERYIVADPPRYTITFLADGTYQLNADCNTGGGSYTLDGNNLSLGPARLTKMACPPDSQDAAFLTNLEATQTYFVTGKSMYIGTSDGGTMKFARTR